MSDLSDYRDLLTRTKVGFYYDPDARGDVTIIVPSSSRKGFVNSGDGRYAMLIFDTDGALIEFGVWE